jgi:capsular exopolysaccharide synthesis family protein
VIATTGNAPLEEIRRLYDDKRNGVLSLERDGESVDVFYREGIIDAVSSTLASNRLGQYFLREGYLEAGELEPLLLKSSRHKMTLGEAAVRDQVMDPVELSDILRLQAFELLRHAIENDFTRSGFRPGLRSFHVPAQIHFPHVRLELSRAAAESFEIDAKLLLVLREGKDLSELPWYPQELFVLNSLRYPTTFPELLATTDLPEENLRRMLAVFDELGLIQVLENTSQTADTGSEAETAAVIKRSRVPLEQLIPVTTSAAVNERLEVLNNGTSFVSEQFRNLKIRLSEVESENPIKVLTVSSPNMQDGKSLVSANLALSFSMDPDRRVIIVDCDLRNPTLDQYLAVGIRPGLLQYLDNGHLGPYCYVRRLKNLYFMTAGGATPNPVELLSMNKMKDLIEYLKTDFDTIILDVPPMAPIPDARIVAALSDGLIMVVRMGKTPYHSIENAFKMADRNKMLGVVLNDVQAMPFQSYYSYGYGSGQYGYDSRYLNSNNRKVRKIPRNYLGS